MEYIRPFDRDASFDTGFTGYRAQVVSNLESATIIGSWIGAGGCGPSLHYHASDQAYYLVSGEMNVQLGDKIHNVRAGSFVYIPAGTAHRNWNDSSEEEFHFELIIPAPSFAQPVMTPVDTVSDAPGSDSEAYIRSTSEADFAVPPGFTGMALCQLAKNDKAVINAFRMAPGGAGPGTHIHDFDQYYFVLEGELSIEVALQSHTVPAGTAVLLPAGVPHRQWNGGSEVEIHLALLSPAPAPGLPWDQGVDFKANGIEHTG